MRWTTKEQRDTLMKAMTDAGYTFDFDKRELKKIEQKHVVSLDENGEPILTDFESALFTTISYFWQSYNSGKEINVADFVKEYAPELLEAANKQQKPAWSEEDENHIQHISDFIMRNRVGDTDAIYRLEQDVDWLKSLKDKYTWKPSDEQIKALHDINITGNISYAGQGRELVNLYNDLKKLKRRLKL